MAPRKSRKQHAGKLVLSDEKIREFIAADLSANSYEKNEKYYKGIPEYIISNSNITKLSLADGDRSAYGLVYKVTLKDSVQSPLINLTLNEATPEHGNFGKTVCSANTFFRNKCFKPVRTFLLKLSFISLLDEVAINNRGKYSVTLKNFTNEAKIQNMCYDLTYELGESVVPGCVSPAYYDLYESKGVVNPLFAKLLDPSIDKDGYLANLMAFAKYKKVHQFGLILMEFAEGFQTLDYILKSPSISAFDKARAVDLARTSHIALYNKGIVQGDCHNQNVMVNLGYQGFQRGQVGKALIIDFGRATRSAGPEPIPENYAAISDYINSVCNGAPENRFPQYEWIKLTEPEEIQQVHAIMYLMGERFRILKAKIASAAPSLLKQDALFSRFLQKADFNSFNHVRWKNVTSAYKLLPIANKTVKASASPFKSSAAASPAKSSAAASPAKTASPAKSAVPAKVAAAPAKVAAAPVKKLIAPKPAFKKI